MNAFLVMLRCGMDDFPVRLFPTEQEALAFCEENKSDGKVAEILRHGNHLFKLDASHTIGLAIVNFLAGVPVQVKTFPLD